MRHGAPMTTSPLFHALDMLPPLERLAVSYAPAGLRPLWIGVLALDQRLADAAREGRDPMMIQLRLAWWRDRMDRPAVEWPTGEPLLALLHAWDGERPALKALVDGWEARNVGDVGGAELLAARIAAMVALGRIAGDGQASAIARAASEWLDAEATPGPPLRLSRTMRPLLVLRGMAMRARSGRHSSALADFACAVRLGLLGR